MTELNLPQLDPRVTSAAATAGLKDWSFEDWGLTAYQVALDRQLQYVDEVASGVRSNTIVFCTHPPVVTLGRSTEASDVQDWDGDIIEVSRGGRATYHGPDQLIVYPILDLNKRGRDLHRHMRWLEEVVIEVLGTYGLVGSAESGATGVWVGPKKIASIGIAVKKWVSYHGLSLAVDQNARAYRGINPCGFSSDVMTSLEVQYGEAIDRLDLIARMQKTISASYRY